MKFIGIFVVSAICGCATTLIARYLARRRGIVNNPNPIVPQHSQPVAYLGGIGVLAGCAVTVPVLTAIGFNVTAALPTPLILPAVLFTALGVWDDVTEFKPALKFLLQIAIAVAAATGTTAKFTGIEILDFLFSVFCFLVLVNAFNLVDVCDGLAAGLAIITYLFFAILLPDHALWIAVVAGSCLGFLCWNRPIASIFLGDAGSHFLGCIAASLTILLFNENSAWPAMPQAVLINGVVLFELLFLIAVRSGKGIPWWRGSPDHFALRLQQAGCSRIQTDLIAWGVAAMLGLAAITLYHVSMAVQFIIIFLCVLIHAGFAWKLLKWDVGRV